MQTGNSAIVAFFVTSPCMKELKSQNSILSNPEQAGGKPLNDGKKKRPRRVATPEFVLDSTAFSFTLLMRSCGLSFLCCELQDQRSSFCVLTS